MNNKLILTAFGLLAIALIPTQLLGDVPKDDVAIVNQTINFYNLEDAPPAIPFLSIVFEEVSKKEIVQIDQWQTEIDGKLKKLGGVHANEDYKNAMDLIVKYVPKFTATSATVILFDFPRIRSGFAIVRKKDDAL